LSNNLKIKINKKMKKNIILGVVILILILVIIFSYLKNTKTKEQTIPKQNSVAKEEKTTETKKIPSPPVIPNFEEIEKNKQVSSTEDKLIELIAQNHSKDLSEVSLNITQEEGDYVRGGVEFAPGGPGNAGMFLATKEKGEWEIVFDGNGNPDCVDLRQNYNFPEEMLVGFCD
jgi:hypothetical protein